MDQYRPFGSLLPPAVKNLMIINGLFFLATWIFAASFNADLIQSLGLYYFDSQYFQPYQFITHFFMHANLTHIASNMFALWMFGSVLENIWGPKRFIIYYLITALGAALLHTAVSAYGIIDLQQAVNAYSLSPTLENYKIFIQDYVPEIYESSFLELLNLSQQADLFQSRTIDYANQLLAATMDIPTVGASGAVFGVLLAFGMLFPNTRIYVFALLPMKAKYFVMAYGAFELYAGLQNNPGDNVAHFAHLGGMLFGYLLIRYWSKRN